jgi:hypothetical protein
MKNEIKIRLLNHIRVYIWVMVIGLFLSGVTAFPIEAELRFLVNSLNPNGLMGVWLHKVYSAVKLSNQNYPFLSFGTDWLAFAHLMLAILFIGPLKQPVKNIWVVEFGIIAGILIFPLAFIAGGIRGIPYFWRCIDCSFGAITLLLLVPCHRLIRKLNYLS